jgi:hypothetical protein
VEAVLVVPRLLLRPRNLSTFRGWRSRKSRGSSDGYNSEPYPRYKVPTVYSVQIAFNHRNAERPSVLYADRASLTLARLLPRGDKHEFRLDLGDQTEVSITMQERKIAKNSVRRYQAIVRGTWSHPCPSTSRVQMRCAARCLPSVGRDHHRQLAQHAIPAGEPIRAICAL